MTKFVVGQMVVRADETDKGSKWPKELLNKPLRVQEVDGARIWLDHIDLLNDKGWLASRFIAEDDPRYQPLKRFF